jgi:hypothetical protein
MAKNKAKAAVEPVVVEDVKGVEFSQFELDAQERNAKRARMAEMDREEREARESQINASQKAVTEHDSRPKFTEGQYQPDPSRSIHLPPPTKEALANTIKPKVSLPTYDPLTASLPPALRDTYGIPTAPAEHKRSITLQPNPATQGSWGARGADAPLSPQEQRIAELQMRPTPPAGIPTKECPVCSEIVPSNLSFHKRASGSTCVIDAEAARRDGVIAG